MNRGWFRKQVADKLLFGVLATSLTGVAFAMYESSNEQTAFAQKNVDTFVSYSRSNFDEVVAALNATIAQLTFFDEKTDPSKLALQRTVITNRAVLDAAKPAFATLDVNDEASIEQAMDTCLAVFAEEAMQAYEVIDLDSSAIQDLKVSLVACREEFIPAFDRLLASVAERTFDSAIEARFVTLGPLRMGWPTLVLILFAVASGLTAWLWYVVSPEE